MGCSDMRLIDADELVRKEIAFVCGPRSGGKTLAMIHGAIRHIVDNAPTVIAEPVVYCDDCQYYSRGICWNENITGNCDCDLEKEPYGYCDWGKRRDGD